jgi:uncharacterized protein with HEPN domain
MSRDYLIRLRDMLAAATRARAYAAGIPDAATLAANQQILDAVMFNLFVLGEAAKGIPSDVRAHHAAVEWRGIAGLRDVLAHEYFGVDHEVVWDVIANELPV